LHPNKSYLLEAKPPPPQKLYWHPQIQIPGKYTEFEPVTSDRNLSPLQLLCFF